jgi:uncharacterized protein (UPF0335 family)
LIRINSSESHLKVFEREFCMPKTAVNLREDDNETEDQKESGKGKAKGMAKDVGGVAGQRLRSFLERIERLEEEKKALGDDVKDIYAEAKGVGFDVTTMRRIIKLRKMEPEKIREQDELLELYKSAIGMAA